jgi:hypothetical protein
MAKCTLISAPIISDLYLTNVPNNYTISGVVQELIKTDDDRNVYLLIIDPEDRHTDDIRYLTDISSISIKYLRQNNANFRNAKSIYYKYNDDLCKLKIIESDDNRISYELTLKINY